MSEDISFFLQKKQGGRRIRTLYFLGLGMSWDGIQGGPLLICHIRPWRAHVRSHVNVDCLRPDLRPFLRESSKASTRSLGMTDFQSAATWQALRLPCCLTREPHGSCPNEFPSPVLVAHGRGSRHGPCRRKAHACSWYGVVLLYCWYSCRILYL